MWRKHAACAALASATAAGFRSLPNKSSVDSTSIGPCRSGDASTPLSVGTASWCSDGRYSGTAASASSTSLASAASRGSTIAFEILNTNSPCAAFPDVHASEVGGPSRVAPQRHLPPARPAHGCFPGRRPAAASADMARGAVGGRTDGVVGRLSSQRTRRRARVLQPDRPTRPMPPRRPSIAISHRPDPSAANPAAGQVTSPRGSTSAGIELIGGLG